VAEEPHRPWRGNRRLKRAAAERPESLKAILDELRNRIDGALAQSRCLLDYTSCDALHASHRGLFSPTSPATLLP
jgi:hypothetical protein